MSFELDLRKKVLSVFTWVNSISVRRVARSQNRDISNNNIAAMKEKCFELHFRKDLYPYDAFLFFFYQENDVKIFDSCIKFLPAVNWMYIPEGRILENNI